ncbi:hypothetical protein LMH87_002922 [Akanthomyces muscarius]|uniref:Uncharacterized protein n=1 Tax=Akanthomyces muscarius TaxID=2231603 RepID=A0A9W8Q7A2_AKAMU|nr:hypothetical protein LMH87_002922 [Akanthomyces muscarius]KAJ4148455.1 hypothetical protein LMH87_002922 [Akanthomyces muscarius]
MAIPSEMDSLLSSQTVLGLDFIPKLQNLTPLSVASTIFAAASPFALYHYSQEPTYVRWSPLLWAKLVVATCLAGIQAANALRMPDIVSVMGAASAFVIVGLTYMEHRRSVRPSLLFTLGLVVNLLNDVESKQVSPFVPEPCWRNHLPGAAVALKLVMIELQDRSKRQLLADDDMPPSTALSTTEEMLDYATSSGPGTAW